MEATKTTKPAGGRKGASKRKPVSKSVKAGLQFPVGRIARFLKKGRYARRLGTGAPIYLAAVLEYLAAEVIIIIIIISQNPLFLDNSRYIFTHYIFSQILLVF